MALLQASANQGRERNLAIWVRAGCGITPVAGGLPPRL